MGMREKFFSFWYPFRTNQKRHLQFSDKLTSKFSGHLLIMVSIFFPISILAPSWYSDN